MDKIKEKVAYLTMATAMVAIFMCIQAVMIICDVSATIKDFFKK